MSSQGGGKIIGLSCFVIAALVLSLRPTLK